MSLIKENRPATQWKEQHRIKIIVIPSLISFPNTHASFWELISGFEGVQVHFHKEKKKKENVQGRTSVECTHGTLSKLTWLTPKSGDWGIQNREKLYRQYMHM